MAAGDAVTSRYKTIFITERALFHQARAIASAPPELDIVMLRQPAPEELTPHYADAVYLISERSGAISAEMIRAMPNLKLILRLGSLTYDIDVEAARTAGVIVCYQPIVGVIRVAEHAILQMLALAKNLNDAQRIVYEARTDWGKSRRTDEDTFAYNWSSRQGINQLYERTVGLVGFGEIGAEVARRLSGWGCTLLYYKRRRLPEAVERELRLSYLQLDELVASADYLVNLLPYSPETDHAINAQTFASMKRGAFIVSVGSGSVIDEAALTEAVRSGRLGGAALDTYEYEPIEPHHPLLTLKDANLILTPHIAAGSYTAALEDRERREDYTAILCHLRGEPIPNRLA
ncbi:MAG: NAD(P)-binding domain-containing protein [Anaerolineae bacterium]|nr:NAD(P)-binding domain-containing protein [Anaerolineae bacterium]MDW8170935.1 NAD(P)-dependent oxidoreductase [Anaerolineae bacterium]